MKAPQAKEHQGFARGPGRQGPESDLLLLRKAPVWREPLEDLSFFILMRFVHDGLANCCRSEIRQAQTDATASTM